MFVPYQHVIITKRSDLVNGEGQGDYETPIWEIGGMTKHQIGALHAFWNELDQILATLVDNIDNRRHKKCPTVK